MRRLLAFAALGLVACVNIPGIYDPDAGSGASAARDAGAAHDAPSGPTGSGCTGDLGGGLILCTGTSECSGVAVDHDKHPNCGFRVRGTALDIECICDNQLCPLGLPTTCTQATDMLETQTEAQVCQQINEGRCVPIGATGDAGKPSTGTCDKTCAGECGGDPSCIQICGC